MVMILTKIISFYYFILYKYFYKGSKSIIDCGDVKRILHFIPYLDDNELKGLCDNIPKLMSNVSISNHVSIYLRIASIASAEVLDVLIHNISKSDFSTIFRYKSVLYKISQRGFKSNLETFLLYDDGCRNYNIRDNIKIIIIKQYIDFNNREFDRMIFEKFIKTESCFDILNKGYDGDYEYFLENSKIEIINSYQKILEYKNLKIISETI